MTGTDYTHAVVPLQITGPNSGQAFTPRGLAVEADIRSFSQLGGFTSGFGIGLAEAAASDTDNSFFHLLGDRDNLYDACIIDGGAPSLCGSCEVCDSSRGGREGHDPCRFTRRCEPFKGINRPRKEPRSASTPPPFTRTNSRVGLIERKRVRKSAARENVFLNFPGGFRRNANGRDGSWTRPGH